MGFQFEHTSFIYFFASILVIIAAYLSYLFWRKKALKKLGDPRLIKSLITPIIPGRRHFKFSLTALALIAGIVAAMNLRKPSGNAIQKKNGIDIVFALDVSKSMMAQDMLPSRMDKAKQLISSIIKTQPDNRYALVIFAGGAYLQLPLTNDINAAQLYVSSTTAGAVPSQGTNISQAIIRSEGIFPKDGATYKTIILITDGEDHDANALSTAGKAATQGIVINTVGMGSSEGITIPDENGKPKKDANGNEIITKLNESLLKDIAANTQGIYVHFDNETNASNSLTKQLAAIPTKPIQDMSFMNFDSYYMYFAAFMLFLLFVELLMPLTKKRMAS